MMHPVGLPRFGDESYVDGQRRRHNADMNTYFSTLGVTPNVEHLRKLARYATLNEQQRDFLLEPQTTVTIAGEQYPLTGEDILSLVGESGEISTSSGWGGGSSDMLKAWLSQALAPKYTYSYDTVKPVNPSSTKDRRPTASMALNAGKRVGLLENVNRMDSRGDFIRVAENPFEVPRD